MRLDTTQSVIERTNIGSSSKFSIANNSHTANLLSDMLYSDKISAVIREIACNGVDSHTEAGIPTRPIDVHLPDAFDKSFWVRDYGVSMTEETVRNLYSTFGESTKQKSDIMTGGFGIGSKAPFAFTDSFTVETYLNGIRKVFTAFKNEIGEREITLLVSDKTEEENGVKILVPVSDDNTYEFVEKAQEIFSVFDVHPNMFGNSKYKKSQIFKNLSDSGENWEIYKTNINDRYYNMHLIAGNVKYPIDISKIFTDIRFRLYDFTIFMKAEISEISPTPSRESLQYNEKTISFIKNTFKNIFNTIEKNINRKLDNASNLYDASVEFYKSKEDIFVIYKYLYNNVPTYKGKNILPAQLTLKSNKVKFYHANVSEYRELPKFSKSINIHFHYSTNILFRNTKGKEGRNEIIKYIKKHQKSINSDAEIIIFDSLNEKYISEIMDKLGNPTIIDLSDKVTSTIQKFDIMSLDSLNFETVSENDEIFYLCRNEYNSYDETLYRSYKNYLQIYIGKSTIMYHDSVFMFENFKNYLIKELGKEIKIHLIEKPSLNSIKNFKSWTNLSDHFKKYQDKMFEKFEEKYGINAVKYLDLSFYKGSYNRTHILTNIFNNIDLFKEVVKNTNNSQVQLILKDLEIYLQIEQQTTNSSSEMEFINTLVQSRFHVNSDFSKEICKVIVDKLPLMDLIFSSHKSKIKKYDTEIRNYLEKQLT